MQGEVDIRLVALSYRYWDKLQEWYEALGVPTPPPPHTHTHTHKHAHTPRLTSSKMGEA